MSTHETLGLMLVREGVINRSQLYDALRLQRQNNRLLGTCLLSLGYLSADRLLQILSQQLQVPVLPPGSLKWAAQDAVAKVPRELALKLRVVPYSFDGHMLGVAVADGRVLEHLHSVARSARAAVGAYIALEMEIEAALGKLYGHAEVAEVLADNPDPLPGRPRPMRVESAKEVPSRDFGAALGLDDPEPIVLEKRKPDAAPGAAQLPGGGPAPAPAQRPAPVNPVAAGVVPPAQPIVPRPATRAAPPAVAAAPPVAAAPAAAAPVVAAPPAAAAPPYAAPPPAVAAPPAASAPPPAAAAPPPAASAPASAPPPAAAMPAPSAPSVPAAVPGSATMRPISVPPPPASAGLSASPDEAPSAPAPESPGAVAFGSDSAGVAPTTEATSGEPAADGALERLGLYAAVEKIYAASSTDEVGSLVGRALLEYFARVLVFTLEGRQLKLVAFGGAAPNRRSIALEAVPEVVAGLGRRNISYGAASDDPRSDELCDMFGMPESATSLMAPIDSESQVRLLVYADNGDRADLYDDLHDVELLFKEAETALNMLVGA